MLAVCGNLESANKASPAEADADEAADEAEGCGFDLNEEHDAPGLPADGAEDADFAGALEDRHGHGVGDAEDAHEQRYAGCSPGDGVGQADELIVGGAIGGGLGVEAGEGSFDFMLGALQVVVDGFAGGGGAQMDVEAGDFALQAGKLLQLVEGHDDGAGLEGGSAVVDPDDGEGTAFQLDRVADLLVLALCQ
jgi:hypothetical protein